MRKMGYVAALAGLATLAGGTEALKAYNKVEASLPPVSSIVGHKVALTTRIYSKDGKLIATLFKENRTWTPLEKIAPSMKRAIVAIEDRRFFEHDGVDRRGIVRAALGNLRGGSVGEGASTLTMQLVRNVLKDNSHTYQRKLREALMAQQLETVTTKGKILERYLNEVYFGHGCYGVASASQYYFGRSPDKLEVGQAAMLAALPQSPDYLSSRDHRQALRHRQVQVLEAMADQGMISHAKLEASLDRPLSQWVDHPHTGGNQSVLKYPYYTSYVIRELSQRYDPATLYGGGLTVVTSLDTRAQAKAEATLRSVMARSGDSYGAHQGALVALDNKTGEVKAMVGGTAWSKNNQFNRAWQARRQCGSSFKPFVYSAALESGVQPGDKVSDQPSKFSLDGKQWWEPKNSDGKFLGILPVWRALMLSRNLCAAQLVAQTGPDQVLNMAHRVGLGESAKPELSLALGALEASPLQMAQAYSTLVNDGAYRPAVTILSVRDAKGHALSNLRQGPRQVIDPSVTRRMTLMMQNVVGGGTGMAAALPNAPVAGKTGTSDNCKDAWFCGFTPTWTTAVWVGNDNNKPMYGCFGGTLPATVWHDFMASAAPVSKRTYFPSSNDQKPVQMAVCSVTNEPANPDCQHHYNAVFDAASIPSGCKQCTAAKHKKLLRIDLADNDNAPADSATLTASTSSNGELKVEEFTPDYQLEEAPEVEH